MPKLVCRLAALSLALAVPALAAMPTPSEFLGFTVGADRQLADYRQIRAYFDRLDAESPRVQIEVLGPTTLGAEMFMAVISAEENIRDLERIRAQSRRVADPRGLSAAERKALERDGKVVLLVTCNIHSTEIGASQMAMEWAHALATTEDETTRGWLRDVVLLLVPSLNPDGQTMETEWYRKQLGTRHEGMRMPWLYHPYVGHDNNRDWFMLTQNETRAMSRAVYQRWFPQVWLDEHQMGALGPRMFVPPYAEPVDADIHPLVWREVNLIGAAMALRLEQAGKSGVIYGYAFDAYWPGGTMNTAWWKNISGLLTEVASARMATPIRIEPGELQGGRKGLIEYTPQTNFPNPWPGGWWRLRDVLDYQRLASDALLETCATHRRDFLRNAIARAEAVIDSFGARQAYRIPAAQRDPAAAARLAALLAEHGVELAAAANGDVFVPLAQPYGRFVAEMLDTQRYPEVKLVGGRDIVRPYDVSAWSLPLMMGVEVERTTLAEGLGPYAPRPAAAASGAGSAFALAPGGAENAKAINAALRAKGRVAVLRAGQEHAGGAWPAGTVFLDGAAARAAAAAAEPGVAWTAVEAIPEAAEPLTAPRVGLYKPWLASMDEGWTRFVLEQYGFAPKTLDNKTIRAGKLRASYDVIVLPDVTKEVIAGGKPKREESDMRYWIEAPAEYEGGLDTDGGKAIERFVAEGGTLVAFSAATEYVLERFNLPVRNALAGVKSDDFSSPGALLRVAVAGDHPVTYGLPAELAVFQDKALAFETTIPAADLERWVLASYPAAPRDVLLSGWLRGEERLTRRAAAVAVTMGKGKIVLLGFRPQHRAQTPATFPFLFNTLYWSTAR